jgi:hypothetical protein
MARKAVYCPYCSATNGAVKKAGALKIIHDKFRAKKTADEMEKWKRTFAPAVEAQKELGMYINKAVTEDLNPLKVLDLFKRISDEVCPSKKFVMRDADIGFRIVNYSASARLSVGQRNISGNTYLSLLSAFGRPLLRTERPMKMISPLS